MPAKYSIIIPTRNRAEFLPYAIKSVLDSSRNDVEIIVSNNFSTDATSDVLSKIIDPRIRIVSPSVSLPMACHYEFAIRQATGEWITILGDDDAVMPYIFDSLDEYIDHYPQIDIISSSRAYYFWQGCEDLYGNTVVSYQSSPKTQIRSTTCDLLDALRGFRSCFDLPQIYTTGIIKRSLCEEIKEKSGGNFYHSIIPDIYSAVVLCLVRQKYLRVDEPLFWTGTSNKSMGRSDRIYRDSEQCAKTLDDQLSAVPRAISENVSYALHSSGFGSLYLYECLLRCPLKFKELNVDSLRAIVLASMLNDLRKRTKNERVRLYREILRECHRYSLPLNQIKLYALLFLSYSLFLKIRGLPIRLLRKLGLFRNITGAVKFYSTSRQMFPSISDASCKIVALRVSLFRI